MTDEHRHRGAIRALPSTNGKLFLPESLPSGVEMASRAGITKAFLWLAVLIAGLGALTAGWTTPWRYRWLLCVPSIGILVLLVLTVTAFWPMNAALYRHGIGSANDTITDAQSIAMARLWVRLDWIRVAGATAAFVAALRALTLPWPGERAGKDPPVVRGLLVLGLAGVVAFILWFVSNI